jgi:sugar O-acyltransferase (sialic acid O-acetyltransferase NeuD family)
MIIIGAGGLGLQILTIAATQLTNRANICFYDEAHTADILYGVEIIHQPEALAYYFNQKDKRFVVAVAEPVRRQSLFEMAISSGGVAHTLISPHAHISPFEVQVASGVMVLTGAIIEAGVCIEAGALINLSATIAHQSYIGAFAEISPGVHISGGCIIGKGARIGTGAVILPNITIGEYAIVGAGAVVRQPVAAGTRVAGVPARLLNKSK